MPSFHEDDALSRRSNPIAIPGGGGGGVGVHPSSSPLVVGESADSSYAGGVHSKPLETRGGGGGGGGRTPGFVNPLARGGEGVGGGGGGMRLSPPPPPQRPASSNTNSIGSGVASREPFTSLGRGGGGGGGGFSRSSSQELPQEQQQQQRAVVGGGDMTTVSEIEARAQMQTPKRGGPSGSLEDVLALRCTAACSASVLMEGFRGRGAAQRMPWVTAAPRSCLVVSLLNPPLIRGEGHLWRVSLWTVDGRRISNNWSTRRSSDDAPSLSSADSGTSATRFQVWLDLERGGTCAPPGGKICIYAEAVGVSRWRAESSGLRALAVGQAWLQLDSAGSGACKTAASGLSSDDALPLSHEAALSVAIPMNTVSFRGSGGTHALATLALSVSLVSTRRAPQQIDMIWPPSSVVGPPPELCRGPTIAPGELSLAAANSRTDVYLTARGLDLEVERTSSELLEVYAHVVDGHGRVATAAERDVEGVYPVFLGALEDSSGSGAPGAVRGAWQSMACVSVAERLLGDPGAHVLFYVLRRDRQQQVCAFACLPLMPQPLQLLSSAAGYRIPICSHADALEALPKLFPSESQQGAAAPPSTAADSMPPSYLSVLEGSAFEAGSITVAVEVVSTEPSAVESEVLRDLSSPQFHDGDVLEVLLSSTAGENEHKEEKQPPRRGEAPSPTAEIQAEVLFRGVKPVDLVRVHRPVISRIASLVHHVDRASFVDNSERAVAENALAHVLWSALRVLLVDGLCCAPAARSLAASLEQQLRLGFSPNFLAVALDDVTTAAREDISAGIRAAHEDQRAGENDIFADDDDEEDEDGEHAANLHNVRCFLLAVCVRCAADALMTGAEVGQNADLAHWAKLISQALEDTFQGCSAALRAVGLKTAAGGVGRSKRARGLIRLCRRTLLSLTHLYPSLILALPPAAFVDSFTSLLALFRPSFVVPALRDAVLAFIAHIFQPMEKTGGRIGVHSATSSKSARGDSDGDNSREAWPSPSVPAAAEDAVRALLLPHAASYVAGILAEQHDALGDIPSLPPLLQLLCCQYFRAVCVRTSAVGGEPVVVASGVTAAIVADGLQVLPPPTSHRRRTRQHKFQQLQELQQQRRRRHHGQEQSNVQQREVSLLDPALAVTHITPLLRAMLEFLGSSVGRGDTAADAAASAAGLLLRDTACVCTEAVLQVAAAGDGGLLDGLLNSNSERVRANDIHRVIRAWAVLWDRRLASENGAGKDGSLAIFRLCKVAQAQTRFLQRLLVHIGDLKDPNALPVAADGDGGGQNGDGSGGGNNGKNNGALATRDDTHPSRVWIDLLRLPILMMAATGGNNEAAADSGGSLGLAHKNKGRSLSVVERDASSACAASEPELSSSEAARRMRFQNEVRTQLTQFLSALLRKIASMRAASFGRGMGDDAIDCSAIPRACSELLALLNTASEHKMRTAILESALILCALEAICLDSVEEDNPLRASRVATTTTATVATVAPEASDTVGATAQAAAKTSSVVLMQWFETQLDKICSGCDGSSSGGGGGGGGTASQPWWREEDEAASRSGHDRTAHVDPSCFVVTLLKLARAHREDPIVNLVPQLVPVGACDDAKKAAATAYPAVDCLREHCERMWHCLSRAEQHTQLLVRGYMERYQVPDNKRKMNKQAKTNRPWIVVKSNLMKMTKLPHMREAEAALVSLREMVALSWEFSNSAALPASALAFAKGADVLVTRLRELHMLPTACGTFEMSAGELAVPCAHAKAWVSTLLGRRLNELASNLHASETVDGEFDHRRFESLAAEFMGSSQDAVEALVSTQQWDCALRVCRAAAQCCLQIGCALGRRQQARWGRLATTAAAREIGDNHGGGAAHEPAMLANAVAATKKNCSELFEKLAGLQDAIALALEGGDASACAVPSVLSAAAPRYYAVHFRGDLPASRAEPGAADAGSGQWLVWRLDPSASPEGEAEPANEEGGEEKNGKKRKKKTAASRMRRLSHAVGTKGIDYMLEEGSGSRFVSFLQRRFPDTLVLLPKDPFPSRLPGSTAQVFPILPVSQHQQHWVPMGADDVSASWHVASQVAATQECSDFVAYATAAADEPGGRSLHPSVSGKSAELRISIHPTHSAGTFSAPEPCLGDGCEGAPAVGGTTGVWISPVALASSVAMADVPAQLSAQRWLQSHTAQLHRDALLCRRAIEDSKAHEEDESFGAEERKSLTAARVERSRRVLAVSLEMMLSPQLSPLIGMRGSPILILDAEERRAQLWQKRRKKLKRALVRQQKEAKADGLPPPVQPDFDALEKEAMNLSPESQALQKLSRVHREAMQAVQAALQLHREATTRPDAASTAGQHVCVWLEGMYHGLNTGVIL